MDKKGVSKADANKIAQSVITRELERIFVKIADVAICLMIILKIKVHVL